MARELLAKDQVAHPHNVSLGKTGEELACRELCRRGYEILDRRYRTRSGELDIVARDRDTIVFIEVKARLSDICGSASEAITSSKQRRLAQMAQDYVARRRLFDWPARFDVVTVTFGDNQKPHVEVIAAAFELGG